MAKQKQYLGSKQAIRKQTAGFYGPHKRNYCEKNEGNVKLLDQIHRVAKEETFH